MPSASPTLTAGMPKYADVVKSPSISSRRRPASASAAAVASATSSSGDTPGPTSPSRDSAAPAIDTAPRSGSGDIEDDPPVVVLAGADGHADAHVVRRDPDDRAHHAT